MSYGYNLSNSIGCMVVLLIVAISSMVLYKSFQKEDHSGNATFWQRMKSRVTGYLLCIIPFIFIYLIKWDSMDDNFNMIKVVALLGVISFILMFMGLIMNNLEHPWRADKINYDKLIGIAISTTLIFGTAEISLFFRLLVTDCFTKL